MGYIIVAYLSLIIVAWLGFRVITAWGDYFWEYKLNEINRSACPNVTLSKEDS